jgi:DNA-binding XRE family transcriptional regulator
MATKKKIRHVGRGRKLTSEEAAEYRQIRAQVEAEKPAINARIRQQLARAGALAELFAELKRTREAMGLSLSDMQARTGIDRSTISKLETGRRTNYTLETALRYADALGKQVLVTLADKP